uniref:C2H2-type domain-containing protein n=1 Tax=Lygus hesperus TaxID=30085 RepID=A0A0A9Z5T9_LYGHE
MPVCDICGKSISFRCNLVRHYREVHRSLPPEKIKYGCPRSNGDNLKKNERHTHAEKKMVCRTCEKSFRYNFDFEKHITEEHNIKITNETKTFESKAEFDLWKRSIEAETPVKYIVRDAKQVNENRVIQYRCNRDGFYKAAVSGRKRELKRQGSCKINGHCPARMAVTIFHSGKVEVNFVPTHYGHELQLVHVPISSHMRQQVAAKLAANIPKDKVLEDIHNQISGEVRRDDLLTKQDLRNLMRDFKINNEHKFHSDDESNVEFLIDGSRCHETTDDVTKRDQGTAEIHDSRKSDLAKHAHENMCDDVVIEDMKRASMDIFNRILQGCTSKEQVAFLLKTLDNMVPQFQALDKLPCSTRADLPLNQNKRARKLQKFHTVDYAKGKKSKVPAPAK